MIHVMIYQRKMLISNQLFFRQECFVAQGLRCDAWGWSKIPRVEFVEKIKRGRTRRGSFSSTFTEHQGREIYLAERRCFMKNSGWEQFFTK
ncbi:MAG: hypothetical protein C0613_07725 [Desulfobulbaceae bacterium]|nr:MAG: hypothetical protein C0613_07725 [Desulfobulbaceae bacterium]